MCFDLYSLNFARNEKSAISLFEHLAKFRLSNGRSAPNCSKTENPSQVLNFKVKLSSFEERTRAPKAPPTKTPAYYIIRSGASPFK